MSEKRVLFVLKYRENNYDSGSKWIDTDNDGKRPLPSGLYNSANFMCDMLTKSGIAAKLVHVIDNNFIHREIVEFKPTHVIIEAFWVVPEKFDELFKVCPNVTFIIRNHSETPFLANEGIGFDWTLRYVDKPNVLMSCNAPRMLEETRFLVQKIYPEWSKEKVISKVPYLPNYYPIPDVIPDHNIDPNSDTVRVGCFGAIRPLKNQMIQAVASIKFAHMVNKKLSFHINATRIEMNGAPIIHNLRGLFGKYDDYELVEEPWRPHYAFKELMATMDILSQVSFSETFNIVAADAVTLGVPVVTSNEIVWSSKLFRANPTDSNSVADALKIAYNTKLAFPKFNPSLGGLKGYNKKSVKIWTSFFS